MKGYCYADLDGNIVYKVADYIDNLNPGFFGTNRHLISKHWQFDTDDASSMLRMFKSFEDLKVTKPQVGTFIKCINYDMTKLKDANSV